MAAALLQAGADAGARDELGHTPLKVAAARGRREVVELLLARETPGGGGGEWPPPDVDAFMRQSAEELAAAEAGAVSAAPAAAPHAASCASGWQPSPPLSSIVAKRMPASTCRLHRARRRGGRRWPACRGRRWRTRRRRSS